MQRETNRPAWADIALVTLILLGTALYICVLPHSLEHPFSRSTAFGRVDFRTEVEALQYDEMKELMQGTPSRCLYWYPTMAYLYLMLDVENPTAHGFFVPGYSGPDLVQEVLGSLAATRPPYIVCLAALAKPGDPVGNWITEHCEPIGDDGPVASLTFRRKQG